MANRRGRRLAIRLAACAPIGAATTIAVAWGLALIPHGAGKPVSKVSFNAGHVSFNTVSFDVHTVRGPGYERVQSWQRYDDLEPRRITWKPPKADRFPTWSVTHLQNQWKT